MLVADIFGVLGGVGSAFASLPQAARSWRQPTYGVSGVTYQLASVGNSFWFVYGITQGLGLVAASNLLGATLSASVLYCMRRDGRRYREIVPVIAVGLLIGAVLVAAGLSEWLGWYGGAISVGMRIPQVLAAARRPDISGISIHTWITAGTANA